jgi:hypothetical protein
MTEAEIGLILAMCARAAESWSMGEEHHAERWFSGALEMVSSRGGFVDRDERSGAA